MSSKDSQSIPLADVPSSDEKAQHSEASSSSRVSSSIEQEARNSMTVNEKEPLTQTEQKDLEAGLPSPHPKKNLASLAFWSIANIISTVAIVFINKRIFSSKAFNSAQFLFGAYHFLLASIILGLLSSPSPHLASIKQFERRSVSLRSIFPLAASMSLNVVFLNTSLQFCSVLFYQIVRVLLTPVVAGIEYSFYGKGIPRQAAWTLLPVCAGVAWLAASDTKSKSTEDDGQITTVFGASFALTGVIISSVYTVWVRSYQTKLDMSGTQLLLAQSPLGAVMLAAAGLLSRQIPDFRAFDNEMWLAILASGLCSIVLNVSQFNFVGGAGSVAGTMIGHVKSIIIVVLGWAMSGKAVSDGSIGGIVMAIGGIGAYTWAASRYG